MIDFAAWPAPQGSVQVVEWLLTYLLHSSVCLGGVWLLVKVRSVSLPYREILWKCALIGGVLTSLVPAVGGIGVFTLSLTGQSRGAPQETRWTTGRGDVPGTAASIGRPSTEQPGAFIGSSAASSSRTRANSGSGSTPVENWAGVVVFLWLVIGAVIAGYRSIQTRLYFRRIAYRRPVSCHRLHAMLTSLQDDAHYRQPVRLTISDRIPAPAALGTREICLPSDLVGELSESQLRSLLAHELAHLYYRDPVYLLALTAIESLLFFQPLNYVASGRLRELFEERSDRWAVRLTGRAKPLAELLLRIATRTVSSARLAGVSTMSARKSLLTDRIRQLSHVNGELEMETLNWKSMFAGCLVLVLMACAAPEVTVQEAAEPPPPEPVPAVAQTVIPDSPVADTVAASPASPVPVPGPVPSPLIAPPGPVLPPVPHQVAPGDTDSLAQLQKELQDLQAEIQELHERHRRLLHEYMQERQEIAMKEQREAMEELRKRLPQIKKHLDSLDIDGPGLRENLREHLEMEREELEEQRGDREIW